MLNSLVVSFSSPNPLFFYFFPTDQLNLILFAEVKLEDNTNIAGQTSLEGKTPVANNTTLDNLTPEPMEIHNDTTEDLSPCDMDISSPD